MVSVSQYEPGTGDDANQSAYAISSWRCPSVSMSQELMMTSVSQHESGAGDDANQSAYARNW